MGSTCLISLVVVALLLPSKGFSVERLGFQTDRRPNTRYHHPSSPSKELESTTSDNFLPPHSSDGDKIGLYVHIPYCRRRCRYCNFSIVPIGSKVQTELDDANDDVDATTKGFLEMDQSYREAILKEIDLIRHTQTQSDITLQSIYFGGGTPSLAPLETIQSILEALLSNNESNSEDTPLFTLAPDAEVSIEMDPGTFSLQKLQALKEMGFNRISLGVQSFEDGILESIGRLHRRKDVLEAIAMIEQVFDESINYSIDLISGLPGLSLALWTETLATAVALRPPPAHISLYDLQIEQGTVFGNWYGDSSDENSSNSAVSQQTRGSSPIARGVLPSPEDSAFMYKYAAGYLRAKGYEHYEVSSYARGRSNRSQHNQIYWETDGQWFALGLGATSFVQGKMTARPKTMVDYRRWVMEEAQLEKNHAEDTSMDPMDFLTDVIMKRLRTSGGLDLNWIRQNYGQDNLDAVLRGAALGLELGLMTVEEEEEEVSPPTKILRLVDPEGFLYSNNLISSIFLELEEFEDD